MSDIKKEVKEKKTTKKVVKEKPKKVVTPKKKEISTEKKIETVVKKEQESPNLSKKDQQNYKTLCKILRVVSKIGRIFFMIFVPFIVLAMFLVPIIFSKFEATSNVIKFGDISAIVRENTVSFKIGDSVKIFDCNTDEINHIANFLSEHSKVQIIISLELSLLLLTAVVILEIYLLSSMEKLFTNFEKKKTPFTEENTECILSIGKYLILIKVTIICMTLTGIFANNVTSIGLIELLVVFVAYYIFKYATALQQKNEDKIYN